jgi:hypothetical protein
MGNDNHKEKRQVGAAVVPTREALTRTQLETLHTVVNTLSPFILGHRSIFMMSEEETPRKIDGGAAIAAAVTFANVCGRIDAILADQTRWDTSKHDELYGSIQAVQNAQVEYLKAQTDAAKSPAYQLRPIIANDGFQFICYHGDITKSGYAIIGCGQTPAEALAAFDAAFHKTPQQQVIMASQAAADEAPKPKRSKPKTEPPSGSLI